MAVANISENIELQEEDHTNYDNETTITASIINVEMSEEGHYERLDLQKRDDAVYGDLQTKTKKEKDLEKILQSGQRSKTVRGPVRVVTGSLGMLCLMMLGGIIGLVVHYNSVINNLTLNRDRLQIDYTNLTLERNQLKSDYTNLTLERNQLNTSYNNVILERNQLNTSNNKLTLENDRLTSEVNQLQAVKSCPDGWMKFGERCYYRSTEKKTWEESRNECWKAGADLVIINSKKEQDLIGRLNHGCEVLPSTETWIGLQNSRSQWTWVDLSPLTTGYWGSGYPGSTRSVCAYYWQSDGLWYHSSCSDKRTWICEK